MFLERVFNAKNVFWTYCDFKIKWDKPRMPHCYLMQEGHHGSSCRQGKAENEMTCVGTPPFGKHVARISQWHVARVISRTIIIRIPLRIRMIQFSYPDRLKERQMTFQLLLSKGRANVAGRAQISRQPS